MCYTDYYKVVHKERMVYVMKSFLKVLTGLCVALTVLVIVKLVADACEPCMHKYFEVEK